MNKHTLLLFSKNATIVNVIKKVITLGVVR